MRKRNMILRLGCLTGCMAAVVADESIAQVFDSGSDGSFGEILVASGETLTLDMEALGILDGIFNATTITVESTGVLRFGRNPLNTPVYLLATGDITVDGKIHVNGGIGTSNPPVGGKGGPGGFDGGTPGFGAGVPSGAGLGPGAGLAGGGAGGYGSSIGGATDGAAYGSPLLLPLVGGSGGGGSDGQPGGGGHGGGGAVLLASNTRVHVTGTVEALGAVTSSCTARRFGSGGGIRIVAPIVSGFGRIDVVTSNCATTAAGRIRIDAIDRSQLTLTFDPLSQTSVGTFMAVFNDVTPRLDITEAAGQMIAVGTADPVFITLPFGSSPDRQVTVQGTDFTGLVPISVVLTPESGAPIVIDTDLDMSQGNPSSVTVDVTLPINTLIHVNAWTR